MTGASVGGALGASIGAREERAGKGVCCVCWLPLSRLRLLLARPHALHPLSLLTPSLLTPPHARRPGALYGTYEAFRYKVPGIYKVRYIGQTTLSSAAVFGLFLGAGSLLHCGRGN